MTPSAPRSEADMFDPHAPDFLADPYPFYARFRDNNPVRAAKAYDALWVFREADARAALLDKDTYKKNAPDRPAIPRNPGPFDVDDYLPAGPFSSDEPWHKALRDVLEPFFGKAIASAGPTARELAQELLSPLSSAGGRVELVAAYALPLPARVLFSVLGLPREHWDVVIGWVTLDDCRARCHTDSEAARARRHREHGARRVFPGPAAASAIKSAERAGG